MIVVRKMRDPNDTKADKNIAHASFSATRPPPRVKAITICARSKAIFWTGLNRNNQISKNIPSTTIIVARDGVPKVPQIYRGSLIQKLHGCWRHECQGGEEQMDDGKEGRRNLEEDDENGNGIPQGTGT